MNQPLYSAVLAVVTAVSGAHAANIPVKDIQVKDIRVPNVVFSIEKNNVCVSVSNAGRTPEDVSVTVACRPKGAAEDSITRTFRARANRVDAVLLPFDMSSYSNRSGSMTVSVSVGSTPLWSREIRVVDSFEGVRGISVKSGKLYDSDGTQCMICTTEEDEANYRKWALVKWVRTRADRSPKKVLLLGSRMVNAPEDGDGLYVDLLKTLTAQKKHALVFEARKGGEFPILEDVVRVRAAMIAHAPQVFVYCPGLEDMEKGVPVGEFIRGVDVLIDQTRLDENPPRVVLVSPLPFLLDMKLWRRYRDAVRDLAARHHVELVDLEGFERFFGAQEGSRVFYRYPIRDGQEGIARAIMGYVY
ncbi:SGNH/GDSL hydrolase family protein [Planctomycetota bacterium]